MDVMRRLFAIACAAAFALIAVATGWAGKGNPTKEQIARTHAGNAAATARILRKADLPSGWTGGSTKPDLSSSFGCRMYKPKQNDLVLIGAAETRWKNLPAEIDSETDVLRTPKMVKIDWRRTVTDHRVLPCLRQAFAMHAPKNEKLVSLRWIAVPRLATFTAAYRLVLRVNGQAGKVHVMVQALAFGAGRYENSLIVSGLASDTASLQKLQSRLAHQLAKRLHG